MFGRGALRHQAGRTERRRAVGRQRRLYPPTPLKREVPRKRRSKRSSPPSVPKCPKRAPKDDRSRRSRFERRAALDALGRHSPDLRPTPPPVPTTTPRTPPRPDQTTAGGWVSSSADLAPDLLHRVVDREELRLGRDVKARLLDRRHQDLAELAEGLLGLRHIDHTDTAVGST